MKFYTYKNGEKAFFSNNEKHLISDEEIRVLYGSVDAMGYATETLAADYIAKKIGTRRFTTPSTVKMIEYMHANNVDFKLKEGKIKANNNKITLEQVFENCQLVAWQACTEWGDEVCDSEMSIEELNSNVIWN